MSKTLDVVNSDSNERLVMSIPTVKELRSQGYKVRVTHRRRYPNAYFGIEDENWTRYEAEKFGYSPRLASLTGGYTKVEITTPEGEDLAGIAECSLKDNFCRKTGRELAIERALAKNES